MNIEDEEEDYGGLYEGGHWEWDDEVEGLVFISDVPQTEIEKKQIFSKVPTGPIDFRDDIDLLEQVRYRRRYQRKIKLGQSEIITLQDVKDIALYTAPVNILSPRLINMLHLPTTERFIRALIICCQYYLQTTAELSSRAFGMEMKIRIPECKQIENEFRDNLADLRLLVAKEYCTMLLGVGDTSKYHHMGVTKKSKSLSDKDARLFETLLRMSVQIIWLALGRKHFYQIASLRVHVSAPFRNMGNSNALTSLPRPDVLQLEVNRMFKSEIFNAVEHTLKTGYVSKMAKEERAVLLGHCVRHDKKLCTRSPLLNEVFCHRDIDYRLMGLGVIKVPEITTRLQYMLLAVAGSEEKLKEAGVALGIIGMPRSAFDTMLKPLGTVNERKSIASLSSPRSSYGSKSSESVKRRSTIFNTPKLYPDIVLPSSGAKLASCPQYYPEESEQVQPCSETQRRRWQARLQKLLRTGGRRSSN